MARVQRSNEEWKQMWIADGKPTLTEFAKKHDIHIQHARRLSSKGRWLLGPKKVELHDALQKLIDTFVADVKKGEIQIEDQKEYDRVMVLFNLAKAIGGNENGEVERK